MAKFSITGLLGLDTSGSEKSVGKLGSALSSFGKVGAAAVAAVAAALGALMVKSAQTFVEFEKGMAEVFTLMPGISKEAMGKMEEDVLKLSKTMGILPEEAVPALYQAISAGYPAENVFEFMEVASKASIGGVTDLETAVDGITSVINAYGRENISAAQAADDMFTAVKLGKTNFEQLSQSIAVVTPVAKAAGVSFKDVMASVAALTATGVPTSEAMTQISSAIVSINTPTKKAEGLARSLGVNFEKLQKDMKKPGGILNVFMELKEKTGGNVGQMKTLLGRMEGAKAVLSMTADGGKKLSAAIKEMADNSGAAGEAFETMENTFDFQIKKMGSRWEAFKIMVGKMLVPILKAIGPIIDEIFTMIEKLPWDEFKEGVERVAVAMKKAFEGEGKSAVSDFLDILFDFLMVLLDMGKATAIWYAALSKMGVFKILNTVLKSLVKLLSTVVDGWARIGDALAAIGLTAERSIERVAAAEAKAAVAKAKREGRAKELTKTEEELKRIASGGITATALERMAQLLSDERKRMKKQSPHLKFAGGTDVSAKELMELFRSNQMGESGVGKAISSTLQGLLQKSEEEISTFGKEGRELLMKGGINREQLEKLMKTGGIDSFEKFYVELGKGNIDLFKLMEKTFGTDFANEVQAKLGQLGKGLPAEQAAQEAAARAAAEAAAVAAHASGQRSDLEKKFAKGAEDAKKMHEENLKIGERQIAKINAGNPSEQMAQLAQAMGNFQIPLPVVIVDESLKKMSDFWGKTKLTATVSEKDSKEAGESYNKTVKDDTGKPFINIKTGKPLTGQELKDAQQKALDNAKSQKAIKKMAEEATKKGSIFTHDEKTQGVLEQLLSVMSADDWESVKAGTTLTGRSLATEEEILEAIKSGRLFESELGSISKELEEFSRTGGMGKGTGGNVWSHLAQLLGEEKAIAIMKKMAEKEKQLAVDAKRQREETKVEVSKVEKAVKKLSEAGGIARRSAGGGLDMDIFNSMDKKLGSIDRTVKGYFTNQ